MALSSTAYYDRAAASGAQFPYRIAVEIQTDAYGFWCDINKPFPAAAGDETCNRLLKEPRVTIKSEVRAGRFATSISPLVLDDHDGYFGKQFPWAIYHSGGYESYLAAIYKKKVKIRIGHHVESASAWTWDTLGVFQVEDLKRKNGVATMKLVGLEKRLMDASAADVKRGDSWLVNVPISEAVEQLLYAAGGTGIALESGSPPTHCRQTTNNKEISLLGNCPPKDDKTWIDHTEIVPRYTFKGTSGDRNHEVYLCGYRKKDGKAAVARWSRGDADEPWDIGLVEAFTAQLPGFEVVYGCQGSGAQANKLFLFLTANEAHSLDPYGAANRLLMILRVDPDASGSHEDSWQGEAVYYDAGLWQIGTLGYEPQMYGSPGALYWGDWYVTPPTENYNIPVFFRSYMSAPARAVSDSLYICSQNNADTGRGEPSPLDDVLDETPSGFSTLPEDLLPGYYAGKLYNEDLPNIARAQLHCDIHESFKHSSDNNKVYYLSWHQTGILSGYWRLCAFNLETGAFTYQRIRFGGSYEGQIWELWDNQPTAFEIDVNASGAGHAWIAYTDLHGPWNGSKPSMDPTIVKMDVPASGDVTVDSYHSFVNNQLTVNEGRRWCPVICSMRLHNNGTDLCGMVVNVFAASGHAFGFWWHASNSINAVFINGDYADRANMPVSTLPFAISREQEVEGLDSVWFAQDQATGTLWRFRWNGGSYFNFDAPLSQGEPVDGENTWASSNLFWDGTILYGVSASGTPADARIEFKRPGGWDPHCPPLAAKTPGGRMSFWYRTEELSDIIRVADFGDASSWDALEMCRMIAGDYVMGITTAGTLRFKERQTTGDALVTLVEKGDNFAATDGTTIAAASIESHLDHKAVANNITIPAWVGERAEPEIELVLGPDSDAAAIGVSVQQTGTGAQRVSLRCIRAGYPQTDDDAEGRPLLFAWTRVHADLTTLLVSAATTSATQLQVRGFYEGADDAVMLGDSEIRAGDTVFVGDSDIVTIASIDVGNGQLVLEDAIGGTATHWLGSTVTITPKSGHRYADSLDGVCEVAENFIPAGTYGTLTVTSTKQLRPGMVLFRDTSYIQISEILTATTAYVRKTVLSTNTGHPVGGWTAGTILRGAVWFERAGRSYAISDTGLSVAISERAADTYYSGAFREGDRIVITCAGLVSRKMEHAILRATNSASIDKYKKCDWKPRVANRLLTHQRARLLLSSQMVHLAWPPHATKARGLPLLTSLDIGDLIDVKHSYLFPDDDNNTVTHGITGITWDLGRGTMDLDMRSVASAGREGEDVATPGPPVPAKPRYDRYGGQPR